MSDFFSSDGVGLEVVATVVIIVIAIAIRVAGARFVLHQRWPTMDERRRWLVMLRNATLLITLFALMVVWADELRAAAITFLAVGVAIVLATKELIMSISGSVVRATSGSFTIGDRIRVGETRGIVIDHSLLTTSLLEIGPTHVRTGRVITIPNSVFVGSPVANESRGHDFVLHSFVVPVKRAEWRHAHEVLSEAATRLSAPYLVDATAQMQARAERYALSVPNVEAFVLAKPTGVDTVELTVRVPVASRDLWQIENDIHHAWLEASSNGEPTGAPA